MSSPVISIELLADHSDCIPTIAEWFVAQSPEYYAGRSRRDVEDGLAGEMNRDRIPLRLVALNGTKVVGTVVLRKYAGHSEPPLEPGLGGLYVAEGNRRRGIGTALVVVAMEWALQMGMDRLFATTATAGRIFEALGWKQDGFADYGNERLSIYRYDMDRRIGGNGR